METKKILIVDDTPENIDILLGVLANYELYFAVNGESALQMVGEVNPDLILLDIMMPGINGFEVAKKLKQNLATRDIPIIFLTIRSDSESIVKGFELGASDYITKPIEPKEVLMRVKKELLISELTSGLKSNNLKLGQTIEQKDKSLIESEEKFKNIVNNSLVGIFRTSLIGEIIYANKALLDMIGYDLNELTRFHSEELYYDKSERKRFIKELVKNNKVENFQTVIKTKNGDLKLVSVFAIKFDNFITGQMFDITRKKEEELRFWSDKKLKTVKNLTKGISDELDVSLQLLTNNTKYLRSLLQGATLYTKEIERIADLENESDESDYDFLEKKIINLLKENNTVLSNISDLAGAVKEFSYSYEKDDYFDLNKGLMSIVLVSKNMWKLNANISLNLDVDLPLIFCNLPYLNQVFYNLVMSSIKSVDLKHQRLEEWKGNIEISTIHQEGMVYICIKNDGDRSDKLLTGEVRNPFVFEAIDEESEFNFTEIYDIVVNKHQGSISIETDEKEGISFTICLPINGTKENVINYSESYDIAE
ncbi:MAG: response regulator [Rhodothermaceae bacterium]